MPSLKIAPYAATLLMALPMSGCAMKMPSLGVSAFKSTEFSPWPGDPKDVGQGLNGLGLATVPKDGLIVVEGDDAAYGADPAGGAPGINGSTIPRTKTPFPEMLEKYIGVHVENRGYPGDTIAKGAERWAGKPVGDLLIIAYGYNDAKAQTSGDDFKAALDAMIEKAEAQGAAVILLTPPTYADGDLSGAADPLRTAISDARVKYRTNSVDLQKVITSVEAADSNILSDPNFDHQKKPQTALTLPATLNPFAGRASQPKNRAQRNSALFTRIADMLATEVAVVR